MSSINQKTTTGLNDGNSLVIYPYLSAQKLAAATSYLEYLSAGILPEDPFNNARNLFDDSNSEDKKWSKLAKEFLIARIK